jgi:hypothetical protein
VLTMNRAFLEIMAFSSRAVRASSLRIGSSPHARCCSYSSSADVDVGTTKGEERGGGDLHTTNTSD